MVVLRADPWMPEHGMGFEAVPEEEPARADAFVETDDWSTPRTPGPIAPGTVFFVDGVRRVEVRLVAEDDGRRAPGLFGSYAVGAVRCEARAEFGEHEVGRALVVGGGLRAEGVEVEVGPGRLSFPPLTTAGTEPHHPLLGLQGLMLQAEANLAARLATGGDVLVLVDGPLRFFGETRAPVVGVVKRFVRRYLGPEQESLLGRLGPGQRTPVFALGEEAQPPGRYAWYTRLVPLRVPWHDHAGVVRGEVRAGVGLFTAVELADRVAALLPAFAGRPTDPRAPQNLAPVGGLESWLRHRMGHAAVVRRALLQWLMTRGG